MAKNERSVDQILLIGYQPITSTNILPLTERTWQQSEVRMEVGMGLHQELEITEFSEEPRGRLPCEGGSEVCTKLSRHRHQVACSNTFLLRI